VARLSRETIISFRKTILDHFHESGRSFPWRETTDPYRILVSEMMLQQTQTDRVVPKYLAWLEKFPDARTLAEAPFSAVLEMWVGLGYNRRARFLHETCKSVIAGCGGVFPETPAELEKLPGIGPYTARAVSTFSFNAPNSFIETNIRAVYIFFFFRDAESVNDRDILELVEETLDHENPRIWYYALMDYGVSLKKKTTNPNRKSSHYAKQSKFEGSGRQARGAIIRCLTSLGNASLERISDNESIPYERIEAAAQKLVAEGLVSEKNGYYRIS
jgi:A/G-specific adenine glycosylase